MLCLFFRHSALTLTVRRRHCRCGLSLSLSLLVVVTVVTVRSLFDRSLFVHCSFVHCSFVHCSFVYLLSFVVCRSFVCLFVVIDCRRRCHCPLFTVHCVVVHCSLSSLSLFVACCCCLGHGGVWLFACLPSRSSANCCCTTNVQREFERRTTSRLARQQSVQRISEVTKRPHVVGPSSLRVLANEAWQQQRAVGGNALGRCFSSAAALTSPREELPFAGSQPQQGLSVRARTFVATDDTTRGQSVATNVTKQKPLRQLCRTLLSSTLHNCGAFLPLKHACYCVRRAPCSTAGPCSGKISQETAREPGHAASGPRGGASAMVVDLAAVAPKNPLGLDSDGWDAMPAHCDHLHTLARSPPRPLW